MPNTWFREDSEAWEVSRNNRFTLDEWNEVSKSESVLVNGLRIEPDGKVDLLSSLVSKKEFKIEVVDGPAEWDWDKNCLKPSVVLEEL